MIKTQSSYLNIALLTVSDTRNETNDLSGNYLFEQVIDAQHKVIERSIVVDDIYQIRACLSNWIANNEIQVILITGGTGFFARDSTPEAIIPLFDKTIEGFGELFRSLSYQSIGHSTIQSRAIAGMANKTIIFALPGSTNACETAWIQIIKDQLNSKTRPCNFHRLLC
jgi:molybdenum cofactor biosynthesis protein B